MYSYLGQCKFMFRHVVLCIAKLGYVWPCRAMVMYSHGGLSIAMKGCV